MNPPMHPAIIDLRDELARPEHAALSQRLQKETRDFAEMIGMLAAEFGIIMDGMYTPTELLDVCSILHGRLARRRMGESRIII